MRKQAWESYWNSTEHSFIEWLIQLYKAEIGYKRLLNAIPGIKEYGCVLEVGAGKAWISRLLRRQGWHTTCIDSNSTVLMANSKFVDNYIIADMFSLPFPQHYFDLVISCGLLEHFELDIVRNIISEMRMVGKTVVAWIPTCGLEWKILWCIRNILGGNVVSHSYRHSEEDLKRIFVSLGFKDIKTGVVLFGNFFRYIYIYGTIG